MGLSKMGCKCDEMTVDSLRHARLRLLVAAGLAAMVAMMLPPGREKERTVREKVDPVYPELARLLGITGAVKLALTVDCLGRVIDVETIRGELMLAEAAMEAARQWRFTSGSGDARVRIEFKFPMAA
jgi:TonB family protein